MRIGELTIYQEGEPQEFDLEAAQCAITCLPGRVCVAPDKPRTSYGLIELPSIAAEKERPDCGTVVCVGMSRTAQSGDLHDPIPVSPGERVMLRPCKGKWLRDFQSSDGSFSIPEIRFYGLGTARNGAWRIEDEIMAVHRGGSWQPLFDWLVVKRRDNGITDSGLLIANPGSKEKRNTAEVLNVNPNYSYGVRVGDTVVLDTHPNSSMNFAYGDLEDCEMIRQVSEDGHRQVHAILEETA